MTWVPEACTLPTVDQPLRAAEFDDLFATALLLFRGPQERGETELEVRVPASHTAVLNAMDRRAESARTGGLTA
jgi:hypothetical protein